MIGRGWAIGVALAVAPLLGGCDVLLDLDAFGPGQATLPGDGGAAAIGGAGGAGGGGGQAATVSATTLGGSGVDEVQALAIDGDTLWLAGVIEGEVDLGGGPVGAMGERRLFVLALDPSGEHLFSLASTTATDGQLTAFVVKDGRIVLAGNHESLPPTFGPSSLSANSHSWVTVMTQQGQLLAEHRLSGSDEGRIDALVTLGDQLVLAGSLSKGGLLLDGTAILSDENTDTDGFLLSLDEEGVRFARRIGGAGEQRVTTLAQHGSTLYAAGGFAGALLLASKSHMAMSNSDIFVVALDENGIAQQSHHFSGEDEQLPRAMHVDEDGVWLGGWFEGSLVLGEHTLVADGRDMFVVALDSALMPQQAWRDGGSGSEEVRALSPGPDGGVRVVASFDGAIEGSPIVAYGARDGLLAHYDSDGERRALLHFGGDGDERPCCLVEVPGGAVFAGSFEDVLSVDGAQVATASGKRDGFWAMLSDE